MFLCQILVVAAALNSAVATPSSPDIPGKRADDAYTASACAENTCSNCPFTVGSGVGFPQCIIYSNGDLMAKGFPSDDNGQVEIFFDVPPLDPGCRFIIRTPVTDNGCGGNELVAQGATCAPVRIDQTFSALFCCGTGDCGAAGAQPPARRSDSSPASPFTSQAQVTYLEITDRDGKSIKAERTGDAKRNIEPSADAIMPTMPSDHRIFKRACRDFTVTNGPYQADGNTYAISPQVSCAPTAGCSATESASVTTGFTISASAGVGEPMGIISATLGVSIEKSMTREFSADFDFGPGETGYVAFIPIKTCVDGMFEGNCDDAGVPTTACWTTEDNDGNTYGQMRAVLVRG